MKKINLSMVSIVLLLMVFCAESQQTSAPLTIQQIVDSNTFKLTSSNFQDLQMLPSALACPQAGGSNRIPTLSWQNPPAGTASFALTLTDPDAPSGTWLHWFVYNIPPKTTALTNAVLTLSIQGKNTWGNAYYQGPCPPKGKSHHYIFTLYALNRGLPSSPVLTYTNFQYMIQHQSGIIISQTQLRGVFP